MGRVTFPAVFTRLGRTASEFAANWRRFLLIHAVVHALIILLLVPSATLLLQASVWLSGNAAISDEDILFFFLRPLGLVILLFGLAIFAGIGFAEQAGLMTIGFGALLPVLPLYIQEYGIDASGLGIIVASWAVAKLIFEPIFGWWADRHDRRYQMVGGLLLLSVVESPVSVLVVLAAPGAS